MRRLPAFPVFSSFLLGVALLIAPHGALAGGVDGFLSVVEDLPLPPGLEEVDESATMFDTPAGRIAEAYATGMLSEDRVLEFYAATLPQLGWRRASQRAFSREGEVLTLYFSQSDGRLTVRFALSPE